MTLLQVIDIIERVASRQPSINMIVKNDVFRISQAQDVRYGVFAWLQRDHSSAIDSNVFSYQFTFFYVDLLRNDRANEVEIQSVGIQTLDNIIRTLHDLGLETTSYTMQPFNQRFADECAGVYCTVTLDAPLGSVCPDAFEDYNGDFNGDFLIF